MAVSFPIPSAHSKSVITIDNFLGADFTNSPANVDDNKSPNLKNLIRDVPGKVRKCMGYETVKKFRRTDLTRMVEFGVGYDSNFSASIVKDGINYGYLEFLKNMGTPWESWAVSATYQNDLQSILPYEFDYNIVNPPYDGTDQELLEEYYNRYYSEEEGKAVLPDDKTGINGIRYHNYIYLDDYYKLGIRIKINSIPADTSNLGNYYTYCLIPTHLTDSYRINGFHSLRKDEGGLYHIGNLLIHYKVGDETSFNVLYEGANDTRSKSWEFDEHLYIIDGKKLLKYGLDKKESDTKYRESKLTNNVVINEDIEIVIKQFDSTPNVLRLRRANTTSPNGKFTIDRKRNAIIYTDKLTEVGQEVTYNCRYSYRMGTSGSETDVTTSNHYLVGLTDQEEYTVTAVENDAKIPLVTISKDPEGGGEPYEDLNLLTPAFQEQFLGKPSVKDYNLSFTDLDETEPLAEVLDANGEWQELNYGTDYTCDYAQGIITFVTAPGESPVTGEDNIRITAYRTVEGYADRINKCTIGALFGVGGAMDRLFLSGNPEYPNYDWYSAQFDPTYFTDTSYSVLGSSGSAIVGYSVVSNYLAAHKDKYERDQNIILREGDLVESEPSFRIINTLQGAGAVAPFSFAYLATEPIFLTNQGVYAVTAQDVTGEKYAQNRSYFLDGKLLEEENLADAYGFVYDDMYWLCLNDVAYILDGLQPIQTDKSKPYATRQYVGFYRTNLPAYTMWENDGRLFFGTEDGRVCRFYKDKYALESYNDDGEPIECIWETPDIIGKLFFKNKTLSHVAIKLDSAIAASVNIYVMNRGIWEFVRTDHWRARIFQFSKEVFSKHTFSCDKTQKVLPKKLRVKKVDKFRLKLTNNELNESFALYDIGFEYTETSNYMR